jgi:hypothetical protein
MSEEIEQKKRQLQDLLLRIPASGSFESVNLTRQISELTTEIEQRERLERQASQDAGHGIQGDQSR